MPGQLKPTPNRTNIGVRELKNHLTSIVRSIRDAQSEYIVTVHGRPVAVLRPFTEVDSAEEQEKTIDRELSELRELAQQIGDAWTSPQSGVSILEEMREESAWR